jgi:hypothetical protein
VPETVIATATREDNALAQRSLSRRSGDRVVNRDSPPASFASGGPSCPVLASRVFGLAKRERESRRYSRERARAARLGTSETHHRLSAERQIHR